MLVLPYLFLYNSRRYLKVNVKNNGTGNYTLHLKKRFAIPEPTAIRGQDKVTITWNAVDKAKEYLVCIYDGGKKISEVVVTGTSYDYMTISGNGKRKRMAATEQSMRHGSMATAASIQ